MIVDTASTALPVGHIAIGTRPIRIALVNDFEVIVRGLASIVGQFPERVRIVDIEVGDEPNVRAEVALFDTFGGRRQALDRAKAMIDGPFVDHVVLYTWNTSGEFVPAALHAGVSAIVSKTSTAEQLVSILEKVARGEPVAPTESKRSRFAGFGRQLTPREREVLAMLGQGLSNGDIAAELFISTETVRTYVRQTFRKLGVNNRTQAAVRAHEIGLVPAWDTTDAS